MSIDQYDLQNILNMGSDDVNLTPELTQALIVELTRDQRFVDLVFQAYDSVRAV